MMGFIYGKTGLCAVALMVILAGCGTTRSVERVARDDQADLSGRWNDNDSRMVAEEMVDDALLRPWLSRFTAEHNNRPVVVVGEVRNRSSEHIDTSTFVRSIERELLNSGEVRFVAGADVRESIRGERMDQQTQAREDTVSRLGAEVGADFMMRGHITTTTDAIEGQRAITYQVFMELINIESSEIVWLNETSISKFIEQSRRNLF